MFIDDNFDVEANHFQMQRIW